MYIRFASDSSDSGTGVTMTWFAEMPVRPRSHAGEEQYRAYFRASEARRAQTGATLATLRLGLAV
jgi:hypothetical protein